MQRVGSDYNDKIKETMVMNEARHKMETGWQKVTYAANTTKDRQGNIKEKGKIPKNY